MSNSLQPYRLQTARLLCPWNSPGKNTGVGSPSLPQGTFPIQGMNPGLLHCRQILYHLSHQEAPIAHRSPSYIYKYTIIQSFCKYVYHTDIYILDSQNT